jgi:hypothetical protein
MNPLINSILLILLVWFGYRFWKSKPSSEDDSESRKTKPVAPPIGYGGSGAQQSTVISGAATSGRPIDASLGDDNAFVYDKVQRRVNTKVPSTEIIALSLGGRYRQNCYTITDCGPIRHNATTIITTGLSSNSTGGNTDHSCTIPNSNLPVPPSNPIKRVTDCGPSTTSSSRSSIRKPV